MQRLPFSLCIEGDLLIMHYTCRLHTAFPPHQSASVASLVGSLQGRGVGNAHCSAITRCILVSVFSRTLLRIFSAATSSMSSAVGAAAEPFT